MGVFVSWEIAQRANSWAGRNVARWANAAYDQLWREATTELDPIKRAALFIRMNDLLIEEVVVIPVV
jgi:peptide/nickel transport system substrate-binding protein